MGVLCHGAAGLAKRASYPHPMADHSNPAYLSRVMHQRLVREYVPFAAACLNSHNPDFPTLRLGHVSDAAFPHSCSRMDFEVQQVSPEQSFKPVE